MEKRCANREGDMCGPGRLPRAVKNKARARTALALAVAGAAPMVLAPRAPAATNTYNGVSGNWTDATKWSLGHVPLPLEDVVLSNGAGGAFGNVTVTLTTSTPTLSSFTVEGTN